MTVVPYPQPSTPSTTIARPSWIETMDRGLELAELIGNTDFVPRGLRGNQPAILAAILYGHEVGLEPMQSLRSIAVIDGKPTLSAEAQRALIRRAGHELTLEESTSTRATWAGRRKDERTTTRITWTLDDAKRARLAGRPAWQTYPRAMLSARASAELARQIFPDVIAGMPASEEVEDGFVVEPVGELEAAPGDDPPAGATRTRRRRPAGPTTPSTPEPAPSSDPPAPEPSPSDEGVKPEPAPEPAPAEQAPEPDPNVPNRAQLGKLFALFGEKGLTERDDRLAWSEKTLGRKIESSTELTALDVSLLIDELVRYEPPAPLPANEQAVVDAMRNELDAEEVPAEPPAATPAGQPPLPGEDPGADPTKPVPYGEFPDGF